MKRNLAIFALLLASLAVGSWLGERLRPENFRLTGTLTVLESGAPTGISQVGEYAVEWNNANGGQLTVRNQAGKILWQTLAGEPFVFAAQGSEQVTENRGMFRFRDHWQVVCTDQTVDLILENEPGTVTLSGHLYCNNDASVLYNVYFKQPDTNLVMNVWLQDTKTFEMPVEFDRLFLSYATSP